MITLLDTFKLDGFYVTQNYLARPEYYGQYNLLGHDGVDFGHTNKTQAIRCCHKGTCLTATSTTYGKYVLLLGEGYATYYCHLSTVNIVNGQEVKAGEIIGNMGTTGNSTGPHVHFNFCLTDSNDSRLYKDKAHNMGFLDPIYPRDTGVTNKLGVTYDITWVEEQTMSDQKCLPINEYNDLKTDSNNWKFLCTKYDINDPSQIVGKIAEYEAKITGLENAIEENIQGDKELLAELEEAREEIVTQDAKLLVCETEKNKLTDTINTQSIHISELEQEIKDLKLQLSSIPQTPEMTPTLKNWLAMTRLVLWNWLRNSN